MKILTITPLSFAFFGVALAFAIFSVPWHIVRADTACANADPKYGENCGLILTYNIGATSVTANSPLTISAGYQNGASGSCENSLGYNVDGAGWNYWLNNDPQTVTWSGSTPCSTTYSATITLGSIGSHTVNFMARDDRTR